ncbi:MAG: beta-propeller domain-containing protein [Clostridia bacterium]|nr:beta-propeller domain-containing protein [Clostridia bacterium]
MKKYSEILLIAIIAALMCCCLAFFVSCSAGDESPDTGGTNVQEKNIDEADIVKLMSNGRLYCMQSDRMTITQTDENGGLTLLANIVLDRNIPLEMYVNGDKLIAICGLSDYFSEQGSTYYYKGSYSRCAVKIFDLSVLDEAEVTVFNEGAENESGESEGEVLSELPLLYSSVVSSDYLTSRLYLDRSDICLVFTDDGSVDSVYYTENSERKSIEYSFDVSSYQSNVSSSQSLTIFMKISLTKDELVADTVAYNGAALYTVYASDYGMYPIFTTYTYYESEGCGGYYQYIQNTIIIKMNPENLMPKRKLILEDAKLYSRYAMKDYGDYIYVAAHGSGGSTIYALDENLQEVSKISGIAQGESIRAVRYEQTETQRLCYLVTYRQVDPLFKINITDPMSMNIAGELKINGYSAYLHVVGTDRLVGIGYNGTATAANSDVKVTLFDTSSGDPIEINSLIIPLVYYCEVIENPKALMINLENGIIGFSALRYDRINSCYKQGFYLFALNNDEIVDLAYISNFDNGQAGSSAYNYSAFRKYINRAMYADGYLYTVADGLIRSYSLETLKNGEITIVNELSFIDNQANEGGGSGGNNFNE